MDTNRIFLGKLCKRRHEHEQTGGSLRYLSTKGCCIECKRLQSREWSRRNNLQHQELKKRWQENNKSHSAKWKQAYRKSHPFETLCSFAKNSKKTKHKGWECDIDAVFLEQLWERQGGKCYWLGCNIDLLQTARHPLKATLDRLDNSKGYTKNNVVWASGLANMGRRDTPADEFEAILTIVKKSILTRL